MSLNIRDLPTDFQNSEYYRFLTTNAENETTDLDASDDSILVPKDCTKVDGVIRSTEDLTHAIRTMMFWGFDRTPGAIWGAYTGAVLLELDENKKNTDKKDKGSSKWSETTMTKLCEWIPDLEKSQVYLELIALGQFIVVCNIDDTDTYRRMLEIAMSAGTLLFEYLLVTYNVELTQSLTNIAAAEGRIDCLRYLYEHACPWSSIAHDLAAARGHIDCIKYMHEHGCPWDSHVMYWAISGNRPECVKYLHENGCPDIETPVNVASTRNAVSCLQYLLDCGYTWTDDTMRQTAKYGHIECIQCLRAHGCPWTVAAIQWAAASGNIGCVIYMHENGCPWDNSVTNSTAMKGQLACLTYLHEHGCPWNHEASMCAASNGHLNCLRYLHEHGCPCNTFAAWYANERGHTDCVRYLRDQGIEPQLPPGLAAAVAAHYHFIGQE